MKATIDLDPVLYRRLKAEAARRGRTIRELVEEGIRQVLGSSPAHQPADMEVHARPAWFGALRKFAPNARGRHHIKSVRASTVRARILRSPDR